ncbi:MAG: serine/threonine-protein kinase, partial [Acidimicrobiales bacterium]|nr:serine/threonine-protein kinase [Acidimicrobiales bacterium]
MAELIRGRYEPLEMVGAGGQSTVLRAFDHRRGRLVGLKVRPRGSPEDEGSLLSEAGILLGMEPHPLLCRVLEDFFAGDRYFLVMDWVEGTTLADLLAEAGGGLRLPDVVHYLGQVAGALDHLHRHRPPVVHGDVKPANVSVRPDGTAVLVDFGISHRQSAEDEVSPLFALAGTAGYAAPEVAAGQAPSPAADVFSLAATAF